MSRNAMNINDLLESNRRRILALAARHGAKNVRIFGSVARGEARADSDLDVLVDMEPGSSLFDLGGLLMDLQDLLNRKVDVITENMLHWYVRDRVLKEAVPLTKTPLRTSTRSRVVRGGSKRKP